MFSNSHKLKVAFLSAATTALFGFVLAGCAPQSLKDSQADITNTSLARLGTVGDKDVAHVREMGVQYIGSQKSAREYVAPLPSVFDSRVTLTRGNSLSFSGLAEAIYKSQADAGLQAIPVVVMPQLQMNSAGQPVVPAQNNAPGLQPPPAPGNVPAELKGLNLPDIQKFTGADMPDFSETKIPALKYDSVPLKKMLDDVTASNNLAWRFADGKIVIYRYITKTVRMNGIPGSSSLVTSITRSGGGISGGSSGGGTGGSMGGGANGSNGSNGSSGSSSQGSLSQSTKLDADKLDIWESLKKTLPSMLSNNGVAIINPSMGTVTIRDEPVVVEEISRYLTELNASMAKQVAIDVTIYMVSLNENSQYGINWEAAFMAAGNNLGISGASMALPQVAAGAAALSFLIPENATDSTVKKFSGSQLLVTALESVGTITNRYSVPVRTQNLQPVQIANKIQEAYLASQGVTQTANVGAQSTITPGLLTTGLELALLPHIQDTNDLVIQYGVTLSAKKSIRTITSPDGNSSIEAPEVGLSDFVGRVTMRSGETLVMSGLEQLTMQLDETGNLAVGGGYTKNGSHVVMVLSVTPRLETAANDGGTRLAKETKNIWPFKYLRSPEAA